MNTPSTMWLGRDTAVNAARMLVGLTMCVSAISLQAAEYPTFNTRAGINSFSPAYQFDGTKNKLVETADRANEWGTDVFKFDLSANSAGSYGLNLGGSTTLTSLSQTASFQHVFSLPFKTYMFWAWPLGINNSYLNSYWRDGYNASEAQLEYDEIYNLTKHLLQTYNGTGKQFLIGHWEGDWSVRGNFDPNSTPGATAQAGMVAWLNNRQAAVTAARHDTPHSNVEVYHYAEVNLILQKLFGSPMWTMTDNILTSVTLDIVSYSSWEICTDSTFNPSYAQFAMDRIQSKGVFTAAFPSTKKVMIGEQGLPRLNGDLSPRCTEAQQATRSRDVLKWMLNWGAPFCMYWQMYNNEVVSTNQLGFWLVDTTNTKQQVWFEHQDLMGKSHLFKNQVRYWLDRNPTEAEFSAFANAYDTFQPAIQLNTVLNTLSSARYTNSQYLDLLFRNLLNVSNGAGDPDYPGYLSQLNFGTPRSTVLDTVLNSARFSSVISAQAFADYLYLKTLMRATADHGSGEYQATLTQINSSGRAATWRSFLNSNEFEIKELELRGDNVVGSADVAARQFFSFTFPTSTSEWSHLE